MNRSIALFVALVTLLAHILAIHTDGAGNFAFPYEQAYVAYRLARNLVFEGQMIWNPGMTAFESYPSPLWVAVASLGERLSISVNLFCQSIGVLAMLFTTILMAQFRPDRTASLIAPLFLVCSGCMAAAAANGMETSVFTLFVTMAFWSFERGYGARTSLSLILCCLTRPEGALIVASMFVLWLLRPRQLAPKASAAPTIWCFAGPLLVLAGSIALRHRSTGYWLSPTAHALLDPHPGQSADGIAYLRDAVTSSILPLLLVYPVVYWMRGRLSTTGARALFLVSVWFVMVIFQGRDPLPFACALVPVLPLCFLCIQEGLTEALDSPSQLTRRLGLCMFVTALAGSVLASKEPGDIGPIPAERWHARWMSPNGSARYGYEQSLGRSGLIEEIALTNRLRAMGIFARDNLDPISTMLSPWPGALAYLSRLHVFDLLGRASPSPDSPRPGSWTRRERGDVVAALSLAPDYVLPLIDPASRTPTAQEIARVWHDELDSKHDGPERLQAIERALSNFELITIPIYGYNRSTAPIQGEPFFLLRNRSLGLRPKVEIAIDAAEFRVLVRHASHQQIVDLSVELEDELGRIWALRPTGEPVAARGVRARTSVLIYDTGTRVTEMMRGRIPSTLDGSRAVAIRAVLKNPGCEERHAFGVVSEEASVRL